MTEAQRTHSTSQVAKALSVKSGMVRRYHLALEGVMGTSLPRDPQNNGRLVTDEQLAMLQQARELVRANPSLSVEDALKSVLGIYTGPTAPAVPRDELLEAIMLELRGLRREVRAQREDLTALREQNAALTEQVRVLPTPSLRSEEPSAPRVIVVSNSRAEETERMNRYLLGELERRRLEAGAEGKRRKWWRWWHD